MTRRRAALGLAAALTLAGMPGTPIGNAATKNHPTEATTLAAAMTKALGGEASVEATGWLRGQGKLTTRYDFRFARPDRERLLRTGGALNMVKIGGRAVSTVEQISVGMDEFRKIGASGWLRSERATAPAATDALWLNALNQSCCTLASGPAATTVRLLGSAKYGGKPVYQLRFRSISSGGILKTTVLVSKKSFLPLAYTTMAFPALGTSYMQLRYNGHFTITSPHS